MLNLRLLRKCLFLPLVAAEFPSRPVARYYYYWSRGLHHLVVEGMILDSRVATQAEDHRP